MDVRVVVGLNVQRLRREQDISQEELSLRADCTRGYLSGVENGRRNPTILFLASLAKELKADVGDFFVRPAKPGYRTKRAEKPPAGKTKS